MPKFSLCDTLRLSKTGIPIRRHSMRREIAEESLDQPSESAQAGDRVVPENRTGMGICQSYAQGRAFLSGSKGREDPHAQNREKPHPGF